MKVKMEIKMQKYINAEMYKGRTIFGDCMGFNCYCNESHCTGIYFYGQKIKIVLQGCSFCRV